MFFSDAGLTYVVKEVIGKKYFMMSSEKSPADEGELSLGFESHRDLPEDITESFVNFSSSLPTVAIFTLINYLI
jgi:hypothetical protein